VKINQTMKSRMTLSILELIVRYFIHSLKEAGERNFLESLVLINSEDRFTVGASEK